QSLQDLHPVLLDSQIIHSSEQRVTVVIAQLVVELSLVAFQFAIDRLLDLGGQLARDLIFGSPENEWPQRFGKNAGRFRGRCSGDLCWKDVGAAEQPRIKEFKEAPKVPEMVFDRSSGEREPLRRSQKPRRFGRFRGRILDRLSLVEDDGVEL